MKKLLIQNNLKLKLAFLGGIEYGSPVFTQANVE